MYGLTVTPSLTSGIAEVYVQGVTNACSLFDHVCEPAGSCDTRHPNPGTRCTNVFPSGTTITLAAQAYNLGLAPVANVWGGDATSCGTGATCTLTVDHDMHVTVTGNSG